MKTTKQFLAALARKFPKENGEPATDYRLAKLLNVTATTITKYQKHGGTFDDAIALRVAELLNEKPLYVLACMNAERSKNQEVKKVWAAVVTVAIAILATSHWFDYDLIIPAAAAGQLCILC